VGGPQGGAAEKDSIIDVKEAHARARILPLLLGRVQIDFWASVFGGEVSGTTPTGTSKGDVEVKIEDCKLSEVDPLQKLLGVPIDGKVNGELSLSPVDGKFSKATRQGRLLDQEPRRQRRKDEDRGNPRDPAARVDEIVLSTARPTRAC
jgi:type II secretion system protein N